MENLNSFDQDKKDLLKRIEFCLDSAEINTWEEEFLESIQKQVLNARDLSERQMDKLDTIEDVVVNGRGW